MDLPVGASLIMAIMMISREVIHTYKQYMHLLHLCVSLAGTEVPKN